MDDYPRAAVRAGDEGSGSDIPVHGEENHVAAGGGGYWDQQPADAMLARALRRAGP